MNIDVFDITGKKVEVVDIPESVFDVEEREDIVHEVYISIRANMRAGSASTKARSEVRGGGRKPWRQKGTGRARHGTIRSPIWRGGGITFGPKPRKYTKKIPKKVKRKALLSVLTNRLRADNMKVVNEISMNEYKTKWIVSMLSNLGLDNKRTLIISDGYNPYLFKSVANLQNADVKDFKRVSTYDIVIHDDILFTKTAIEKFSEVRA